MRSSIDRSDEHQERCFDAITSNTSRLITCLPVLTEAAYLLGKQHPEHVATLLAWASDKAFAEVVPIQVHHFAEIARLIERYKIQLADACLLNLADRFACEAIFTVDRRDFSKARTASGRSLSIVP